MNPSAVSRRALWLTLLALAGVLTLLARRPRGPVRVAEAPPTASPAPSLATRAPTSPPTGTLAPTPSPALVASSTPSPAPTLVPGPTPVPPPSDTPAPPPTSTPPWPEPLAAPGQSKVGIHVKRNADPYLMEFVRRVKPALIYAVDDVGFLADVKAASPSTVTIGRFDNADYSVVGRVDPAGWAHTFVDQNLERYRLNPGVDYWEGWNEYRPNDPASWDWYTLFEAERARYMQAVGLRAAVGVFSTGNPEWKEMALFIPALRAARDSGGIFTLHEYGAPTMYCGVGGGPNDAPHLPGVETGALALRYRYWYESYLQPQGLGDLRLAITEAGVDGIARQEACGGPPGFGWKDYVEWWSQNGYGTDSPLAYVDQIRWYDAQVRRDSYVIGFALFTIGVLNDPHHASYDLHDIMVPLANYVAGQR